MKTQAEELKEWPDCPKWANAHPGPGWLGAIIYGGILLWQTIELALQGRLHVYFANSTNIFFLTWGIFAFAACVWLIVTIHRARKIMQNG